MAENDLPVETQNPYGGTISASDATTGEQNPYGGTVERATPASTGAPSNVYGGTISSEPQQLDAARVVSKGLKDAANATTDKANTGKNFSWTKYVPTMLAGMGKKTPPMIIDMVESIAGLKNDPNNIDIVKQAVNGYLLPTGDILGGTGLQQGKIIVTDMSIKNGIVSYAPSKLSGEGKQTNYQYSDASLVDGKIPDQQVRVAILFDNYNQPTGLKIGDVKGISPEKVAEIVTSTLQDHSDTYRKNLIDQMPVQGNHRIGGRFDLPTTPDPVKTDKELPAQLRSLSLQSDTFKESLRQMMLSQTDPAAHLYGQVNAALTDPSTGAKAAVLPVVGGIAGLGLLAWFGITKAGRAMGLSSYAGGVLDPTYAIAKLGVSFPKDATDEQKASITTDYMLKHNIVTPQEVELMKMAEMEHKQGRGLTESFMKGMENNSLIFLPLVLKAGGVLSDLPSSATRAVARAASEDVKFMRNPNIEGSGVEPWALPGVLRIFKKGLSADETFKNLSDYMPTKTPIEIAQVMQQAQSSYGIKFSQAGRAGFVRAPTGADNISRMEGEPMQFSPTTGFPIVGALQDFAFKYANNYETMITAPIYKQAYKLFGEVGKQTGLKDTNSSWLFNKAANMAANRSRMVMRNAIMTPEEAGGLAKDLKGTKDLVSAKDLKKQTQAHTEKVSRLTKQIADNEKALSDLTKATENKDIVGTQAKSLRAKRDATEALIPKLKEDLAGANAEVAKAHDAWAKAIQDLPSTMNAGEKAAAIDTIRSAHEADIAAQEARKVADTHRLKLEDYRKARQTITEGMKTAADDAEGIAKGLATKAADLADQSVKAQARITEASQYSLKGRAPVQVRFSTNELGMLTPKVTETGIEITPEYLTIVKDFVDTKKIKESFIGLRAAMKSLSRRQRDIVDQFLTGASMFEIGTGKTVNLVEGTSKGRRGIPKELSEPEVQKFMGIYNTTMRETDAALQRIFEYEGMSQTEVLRLQLTKMRDRDHLFEMSDEDLAQLAADASAVRNEIFGKLYRPSPTVDQIREMSYNPMLAKHSPVATPADFVRSVGAYYQFAVDAIDSSNNMLAGQIKAHAIFDKNIGTKIEKLDLQAKDFENKYNAASEEFVKKQKTLEDARTALRFLDDKKKLILEASKSIVAGETPGAFRTRNPSITQFVRQEGGLSLEKETALKSELQRIGKKDGNGDLNLIRKDGVDLDTMTQKAIKYGYLPEGSGINDLIAMIDKDKVSRRDTGKWTEYGNTQDPATLEHRAKLAELERYEQQFIDEELQGRDPNDVIKEAHDIVQKQVDAAQKEVDSLRSREAEARINARKSRDQYEAYKKRAEEMTAKANKAGEQVKNAERTTRIMKDLSDKESNLQMIADELKGRLDTAEHQKMTADYLIAKESARVVDRANQRILDAETKIENQKAELKALNDQKVNAEAQLNAASDSQGEAIMSAANALRLGYEQVPADILFYTKGLANMNRGVGDSILKLHETLQQIGKSKVEADVIVAEVNAGKSTLLAAILRDVTDEQVRQRLIGLTEGTKGITEQVQTINKANKAWAKKDYTGMKEVLKDHVDTGISKDVDLVTYAPIQKNRPQGENFIYQEVMRVLNKVFRSGVLSGFNAGRYLTGNMIAGSIDFMFNALGNIQDGVPLNMYSLVEASYPRSMRKIDGEFMGPYQKYLNKYSPEKSKRDAAVTPFDTVVFAVNENVDKMFQRANYRGVMIRLAKEKGFEILNDDMLNEFAQKPSNMAAAEQVARSLSYDTAYNSIPAMRSISPVVPFASASIYMMRRLVELPIDHPFLVYALGAFEDKQEHLDRNRMDFFTSMIHADVSKLKPEDLQFWGDMYEKIPPDYFTGKYMSGMKRVFGRLMSYSWMQYGASMPSMAAPYQAAVDAYQHYADPERNKAGKNVAGQTFIENNPYGIGTALKIFGQGPMIEGMQTIYDNWKVRRDKDFNVTVNGNKFMIAQKFDITNPTDQARQTRIREKGMIRYMGEGEFLAGIGYLTASFITGVRVQGLNPTTVLGKFLNDELSRDGILVNGELNQMLKGGKPISEKEFENRVQYKTMFYSFLVEKLAREISKEMDVIDYKNSQLRSAVNGRVNGSAEEYVKLNSEKAARMADQLVYENQLQAISAALKRIDTTFDPGKSGAIILMTNALEKRKRVLSEP